jgi:hypothetical protein
MTRRARLFLGGTLSFLLAALAVQACGSESVKDSPGASGGSGGSGGGDGPSTSVTSTGSAGGDEPFDGGTTATGTGGLDPDAACASVSAEAETKIRPADIVIAIDTSGSMVQETAEVKANLNNFAQIITQAGIDVHVVLLADPATCIAPPLGGAACPGDDNLPGYLHLPIFVASNDALDLFVTHYEEYKAQLRPDAVKTFLVVSDDDSWTSAATFTNQILALDPPMFEGFKFDAIAAADGPGVCAACVQQGCQSCQSKCCDKVQNCYAISWAEGAVYKQLVAQTGGVFADLCGQDFDPVFQDLATAVVESSSIACTYDIPAVPDGGAIDPTKVNVTYTPGGSDVAQTIGYVPGGAAACGASGGWYYDDPAAPSTILLCPATCDVVKADSGARVDVAFGCDTIIAVPD